MKVMWTGPEHVRSLRRGDLGIDPSDDSELVWNADTRFTQEVTDEEFAILKKIGGSWAVVEESEDESKSNDKSSSDQAQPQEGEKSAKSAGKSSQE